VGAASERQWPFLSPELLLLQWEKAFDNRREKSEM
jgi:hypothetical protein